MTLFTFRLLRSQSPLKFAFRSLGTKDQRNIRKMSSTNTADKYSFGFAVFNPHVANHGYSPMENNHPILPQPYHREGSLSSSPSKNGTLMPALLAPCPTNPSFSPTRPWNGETESIPIATLGSPYDYNTFLTTSWNDGGPSLSFGARESGNRPPIAQFHHQPFRMTSLTLPNQRVKVQGRGRITPGRSPPHSYGLSTFSAPSAPRCDAFANGTFTNAGGHEAAEARSIATGGRDDVHTLPNPRLNHTSANNAFPNSMGTAAPQHLVQTHSAHLVTAAEILLTPGMFLQAAKMDPKAVFDAIIALRNEYATLQQHNANLEARFVKLNIELNKKGKACQRDMDRIDRAVEDLAAAVNGETFQELEKRKKRRRIVYEHYDDWE